MSTGRMSIVGSSESASAAAESARAASCTCLRKQMTNRTYKPVLIAANQKPIYVLLAIEVKSAHTSSDRKPNEGDPDHQPGQETDEHQPHKAEDDGASRASDHDRPGNRQVLED
eukprot:scaffold30108_cov31-Tisochrysis_lutea.AAC.5